MFLTWLYKNVINVHMKYNCFLFNVNAKYHKNATLRFLEPRDGAITEWRDLKWLMFEMCSKEFFLFRAFWFRTVFM